ncbi:MAG: hypothetical protein N4A47_05055 [Clostridia bacterium]|nr:hypothetical protein [Clostridia bacterium]
MSNIGLHIGKNKTSLAYVKNNKIVGETVSGEFSEELLRKLFQKAHLPMGRKHNLIFSIPQELIEVNTLHSIPNVRKRRNAERLYRYNVFNLINKSEEQYSIGISEDLDGDAGDEIEVAVADVSKNEVIKYISVLRKFRNLNLRSIDIESEALRRTVGQKGKNVVIIKFYDSDKRNVGIYIYKGNFLIGSRHLILDLYDNAEIKEEIERAIGYSKTKFRNYVADDYYVFGTKEETDGIEKVMRMEFNKFSNSDLAVAVGLQNKNIKVGMNLLPSEYITKDFNTVFVSLATAYIILLIIATYYVYNEKEEIKLINNEIEVINIQEQVLDKELELLSSRIESDEMFTLFNTYVEENIKLETEKDWIQYADFISIVSKIIENIQNDDNGYSIYLDSIESLEGEVVISGQTKGIESINILSNKLKEVEKIENVSLDKFEVEVAEDVVVFALRCKLSYSWE